MEHHQQKKRTNSEIFQDLHNQLDARLRAELDRSENASHHELLEEMANRDPFFGRHRDQLQAYRALRNALVHDPTRSLGPIAEPHERVLETYRKALAYVAEPPTAFHIAVPRAKFFSASWDDLLEDVVRAMETKAYSLAPVFEGDRMEGVFLDCTLTIALGAGAFAHGVPKRLGDLRQHIDLEGTMLGAIEFLPLYAPLREVGACFARAFQERRALRAIFLTTDGTPSGSVRGLITAYDLIAVGGDAASPWFGS